MRLDRFVAKGVHGYLKFDIRFNKDLSFLTGINGSGKTTAINAIIALLTPDLAVLSNLDYQTLAVDISHEKSKIRINSEKGENEFSLSISGVEGALTLPIYSVPNEPASPRQMDHEAEYFKDLLATHQGHPVLRGLSRLPTPMFLGLDRRSRFDFEDRRRYAPPYRQVRAAKNVFSSSLARSLFEAADLAATSNRDALISAARVGDDLRRELFLNLLTVAPEDFDLVVPTRQELQELKQIRHDLRAFPRIFSLPEDELRGRIEPFLDELEKAADLIPGGTQVPDVFKDGPTRVTDATFKWSANRSQLKRIRVISDTVQRYNQRRELLLEPIRRYKSLVNQFLHDSGKSIEFDDDGYVYVAIQDLEGRRDISSLSSGEAQIFVILTHLAFSKNAALANIFIIDEPELSLHVLWQELFVDSVMSANPNIQYIMATHSPSIILEKTKYCIDISRKISSKKN